jgi:hypothetical protein
MLKKISVTFDMDMEVFMKVLHHTNTGVRVDMFGDKPKVKKDPPVKLLASPERVGAKVLIMDYAKAHKDGFVPKDLYPLFEKAGYAKNSSSPQLMWLKAKGYLKRHVSGVYVPTAKGLSYGEG